MEIIHSAYWELDLYCGASPFIMAEQSDGKPAELHICGAERIDLGQRDFEFPTWEELIAFAETLPVVADEAGCVNRRAYWRAFQDAS